MIGDVAQDLRIGVRALARAPATALTIIATVGLGLASTTVIFGAIDAALLRPLPYSNPDQLVRIYTDSPPNRFRFSVADYLTLQAEQTQFEQIAGYTDRAMAFSDGTVAERVRGREVSWTFFGLLGVAPALGRDFTADDGSRGRPPAVMLSHGFWQRRLSGRSDVLGTTVQLNGVNHTVVGVLGPSTRPLEHGQEFFVAAQWETPRRKGPFFIVTLGRLKSGSDRAVAAEELRSINRRMFPVWRSSYQDDRATWSMVDLKEHVTGDVANIAGLALTAVALVWLIACANASNLLIARVTGRRRELAVRAALGASRSRVVNHLLVESAVLAIGAAALGIALTWAGVSALRDFGSAYFPRVQEIALDGTVVLLLIGLTTASVALFGLIPALHGTGGALDESLRSMGRSSTGSVTVRRLRRLIVATQFAVATPLLVAAGLLLASLGALERVDLGFDSRNMLTGFLQLPAARYQEPARVVAFWDHLRHRLEALPGVSGLAFADGRPPNDVGNFNNFDLEDFPTPSGQSQPVTPWVAVTPEYFRVLGLTLLEGRLLDERDAQQPALESVVVDRAWARRFFPNGSAVGKRLREGGCTTCPWTTVVGVVSAVKYAGLDKPDDGTVYWPLGNSPLRYVVMRMSGDTALAMSSVRQVIRELDPHLPFSNVATMEDMVARSLERPRALSRLVAVFAIVALILSVIGIYGVMAYYVRQHSRDISIRMALGGSPGKVLRLILGEGMKVVAGGVAVGLLAAAFVTQLMSSLLFGVGTADPFIFAAVLSVLMSVALVACLAPARRAVGIEPAEVLRND